jgi:hypothetical protein
MYGLGIRLGFYIQWVAGAIASLLQVKSEVAVVRSVLFGFTIAVFVAVVVQTAQSANTTVDIYVTLLLCFGFFYSTLAKYLWRIYIYARDKRRDGDETRNGGGDQIRDSTIWVVAVASPEFDILQQSLLLAVSGYKLWFWATKVLESKDRPECPKYGFLFYRLELESNTMRFVNICVDCCMLPVLAYELASAISRWIDPPANQPGDQRLDQCKPPRWRFQEFNLEDMNIYRLHSLDQGTYRRNKTPETR